LGKHHFSIAQIKQLIFLKEILFLGLTAFGGPGAHFALFQRNLVQKRAYLTLPELLEIHSFCSMLPGPTSTQMITIIGYKQGGNLMAVLSLVIWFLPACISMTFFSLIWHITDKRNIPLDALQFIPAMAVGFIAAASFQVVKYIKKSSLSIILYGLGAICAVLFRSPWIFPVLILLGGFVSHSLNKQEFTQIKPNIKIPWRSASWLVGILIVSAAIGNLTQWKPLLLFENAYQYGCIVFGGGNVLIPMMFKQYVTFKGYVSAADFMTGIGLVQAIPGPIFSISTFVNAMAMEAYGPGGQVVGALIGTVGIFLPGFLIVMFLYPLWNQIKEHHIIKRALDGIIAVSAGLILAAAYLMFREIPYKNEYLMTFVVTLILILTNKIPSPVIVIVTILAGFLYHG
jgi:chromate transporter